MQVLISGGAGFIGSHLLPWILRNTEIDRVVVFDNFSSGQEWHLDGASADKRLEVIKGDLKDSTAIRTAMDGISDVYHLAANPDIAKAATQPDIDFWEGTFLTQNVLEAMRLTTARRIFYTSGSGVYGEDPEVAFPESYGPCRPISTYGASKLACEGLIAAYSHMFGFFGRALRFANVVGPRQTHGVGYDFVRRLRADPRRLRILGDGSQSKSYIYVDDVLEAIAAVDREPDVPFDIYNVATDDYVTVKAIADIAIEECGLDPRQVHLEFTGGERGWKGDVPVVRFDVRKIKSTGWKARLTAEEAVHHSIRAMIDQIGNR